MNQINGKSDFHRANVRRENRERYERVYAKLSKHRDDIRRIADHGPQVGDTELIQVMAALAMFELRKQDVLNEHMWG